MPEYIQYILLFIIVLTGLYILISYISKYFTKRKLVAVLSTASELQQAGDLSGALEHLENNLKVFSFKDPIFASYISFLIANQKYDKAKSILKETTENPQEEFAAVNMLGYLATLEEDFLTSEKHYLRALELDPTKKKAIYTNLAVIYAEQGIKLDQAIDMLNEVLSIEDGANKYPVYVNLGYVLFKKKKFEDALVNEKIGLELIPKGESFDSIRAFAHFIIGLILKNQNKKSDARPEFLIAKQLVRNPKFRTKIQKELSELS